ncbi:MAG: hypothetical protein OJF59_001872 [Cytophagales bacterium]|jgi:hypothetical protein|nr:MAG: hypothetical protein OJF59_001872 [Cytophagales bacterium]
MIGRKVLGKRVTPQLDSHDILKSNLRYVNIRIGWNEIHLKKKSVKGIDVSVYLDSGERLKISKDDWKEGRIFKGKDIDKINSCNNRIDSLVVKVVEYIEKGGMLNKRIIEQSIYGDAFLQQHKKKRTALEIIPIIEVQPTEYLKELRSTYPMQKIKVLERISTIDSEGFEVVTENEKEIIRDQISLDDFPNNLPLKVYAKLVNEFEKENEKIDDPDLFRLSIKYFTRKKFFKDVVVDAQVIDKTILNSVDPKDFVDNETGGFDQEGYELQLLRNKDRFDLEKKKSLIQSLTPEKRFEEGFKYVGGRYVIDHDYFNQNDIIHLLALCRFGKKYIDARDEYEKISDYDNVWKSILDYWVNGEPSTLVRDFDIRWVNNFLKFMVKNGHIKMNHKLSSNPFILNKNEYRGKERSEFAVGSFSNLCKWIKDYISQLYQLKLIPHDFSEGISSTNYHKFHAAYEYEAKHYILPKEFLIVYNAKSAIDKLAPDEFLTKLNIPDHIDLKKRIDAGKKTLYSYGLSKTAVNDFKVVKEILVRTSHLFACQTFLGALRISDFKDEGKTRFKENQSNLYIQFTQRKTKTRVLNPILKPVLEICENYYDGNLPPRFTDGDYNKYLKLLFRVLDFNRPFINQQPSLKGGYNDVESPLHEIITNRFARSTFVALMTAHGVPDKDIMKWTGHRSFDIFRTHYQPILDDERLQKANEVVEKMFGKKEQVKTANE